MRGLCGLLLLACLAGPATAAVNTCLTGSSTKSNSTVIMLYSQFAAMADRLRNRSNNAKSVVSVVRKENATEEGRNIYMFIVRPYFKKNSTANKKPSYWFQGGVAGNDFNSVSLLMDFICEMSSNCAKATCDFNYYVVPMANPDGYEYARTTNASWVKNRQKNNGSSCVGVNLNHNFPPDATFATHGTDDPCSCDNRGAKPKSAKEVAALIEMKSCCAMESNYAMSMTLLPDSEKDRLLWPKASTTVLIPENEKYEKLAGNFDPSGATELKPYSQYKLASGTPMDNCYSADPKAYSLTLKLKNSNVSTRALSNAGKIIGGINKMVAVSGAEKDTQVGMCLAGSSTESNSTVIMSYSQFAAMADKLRNRSNNAKSVVSVVRKENATEEGRNIYMFIVRPYFKKNITPNKKPSFWLQGGVAGNDFDSVSLLMDFICEMSSNCADATCDYNYYVVPMANPDGYEYARTTNASWVKNRQKNNGSSCVGVNLNHNFPPDATFATYGTDDPCSSDNRGAKPKSAKEVAALIEMKSCCAMESSYAMSMTLMPDSEKDRLLWPKASTTVLIPENDKYKKLAGDFDNSGATELKPYSQYKLASGTPMDNCYSADPRAYSLTLKLKKSNVTTRALSNAGKIIGGINNMVAVSGAEKETQLNTTCVEPASEDKLININTTDMTPLNLDTLRSGDCPSYASIVDYLQKKAKGSIKIELVHLPLTYSNASIYMVIVKPYMHSKVSNPRQMPNRSSYWLEGGLEANACDSVTTLLTLVDQLAYKSPKDQQTHIYYILPLLNPQGYEYARTVNSTWVKNREANAGSNCRGVSLNNNFPPADSFNSVNSSTCACDCHYPGKAAGSSEEYQKLTILKASIKPCLSMSIVSSNETCTLLFPNAHSAVDIAEYSKYEKVGMANTKAVEALGGQKVPYMTGGKWSLQSGTSMDHFYSSNPSTASHTTYSLSLAQVQSVSGQLVMTRGKQLMAGLMAMIGEAKM